MNWFKKLFKKEEERWDPYIWILDPSIISSEDVVRKIEVADGDKVVFMEGIPNCIYYKDNYGTPQFKLLPFFEKEEPKE